LGILLDGKTSCSCTLKSLVLVEASGEQAVAVMTSYCHRGR